MLQLTCSIHNHSYTQKASDFLSGRYGCKQCANKNMQESCRKPFDVFMQECIEANGDIYDIDESTYVDNNTPITVTCKKHKHTFEAKPKNLISGYDSCTYCRSGVTKEELISHAKTVQGSKYTYKIDVIPESERNNEPA